jgi:5'-nucleotidase
MKPEILVTNDDGITAPGLLALAKAASKLGRVTVLAPDRNWSGMGHVKTINRPLRVREVIMEDGRKAYASDGAPSDCVALGLLGYFGTGFDLVVSGINPQPNFGHDVTYSGTVTAAMEAIINGVPAIAFSLGSRENHLGLVDYQSAAKISQQIITKTLEHGLPDGILLNVNIPYLGQGEIKGYKITSQGQRVYHSRLDQRVDPRGNPYFWISGDAPSGVPRTGTDIGALQSGYVSITPLQLDLTAYPARSGLERWQWEKIPQTQALFV